VLAVVTGIVFAVAFGLAMLVISCVHRLRSSCSSAQKRYITRPRRILRDTEDAFLGWHSTA